MMCFRDMTFCGSPNCKGECGRKWTDQLSREAERWWNPENNPDKGGAPVCFAYFCGEQDVTGGYKA